MGVETLKRNRTDVRFAITKLARARIEADRRSQDDAIFGEVAEDLAAVIRQLRDIEEKVDTALQPRSSR